MSKQQWAHGWHTGQETGEALGKLLGQGAAQIEYSSAADRLTLLARGLKHEADAGKKSAVWWQTYASVLAKQLHEVAEQLPGVLVHFDEHAPQNEPTFAFCKTEKEKR